MTLRERTGRGLAWLAILTAGCCGCATPAQLVLETQGAVRAVFDGQTGVIQADGAGSAWIQDKASGLVLAGPLVVADGTFLAFRLRPAESASVADVDPPQWAVAQLAAWRALFR